ncbi:HAMP domain-containing protein [Crocosphaera chwakensis]|uniref:histidine kinase n=1 Tax=Crocosphaera chwakensis CCY0110 TaxID=391612 RepID=A3INP8_9CHRO|nr:HAMP domain-containing protein [Crocosphaera chwakensis]EAZ91946.1 two-component sensor histidine kinase [Crocosphaera chwakensis CCY0110]
MIQKFLIHQIESKNKIIKQKGLFWQARSQILLWYVSLMLVFTGFSIPIIYLIVFYQVDSRVEENLKEEIKSFERFKEIHLNEAQEDTNSEQIKEKLDEFLDGVIPEDDNSLITIVDQNIYRSVPQRLPKDIKNESALITRFLSFEQNSLIKPKQYWGEVDKFKYAIKPIIIDQKVKGLFVAIHSRTGERAEAFDILIIFIAVLVTGLIIAFIFAWLASDKILRPLRSLAKTANVIDEFDLKKRIDVTGYGEIYDLTNTFNQMMNRLEFAFER